MEKEKLSLPESNALTEYFKRPDVYKTFKINSDHDKVIQVLNNQIEKLRRALTRNDKFKSERLDKLNRDAENSCAEEDDEFEFNNE